MQKEVIGNATLYCGDVLDVLPRLDGPYDALITDPPYSSGGLHKGQRAVPPSAKYVESPRYAEFSGDNRDQRSWAFWCTQWLTTASRLVSPGGYFMIFSDWRQLPTLTDVLQAAGVLWRGLVVWDKTLSSRAPHTGYFRHQAEYVVWGSQGRLEKCPHGGPFPGVITERVNPAEKLHMTAKPVRLMQELVEPLAADASVLDPFMGSGTTALPVLARGGRFTGIELTNEYFDIACDRIEKAQAMAGV
ncbi:DNA-methyltransferase [Intestinirhabdus alba]|jgi:site-specific DNA-methyltransferase (adenine-specific)|uniref:Methyltransferase n=1 Tax=Intestinirhabdus alba TaxID=2899544 RepID=A0A6L6IPN4_9ENTR|nr:DNA methyltransferase [Intestinirhabdus alba]MTH47486.1 site-specific DNA-methyltransferase [Intestinirhabdus alba]